MFYITQEPQNLPGQQAKKLIFIPIKSTQKKGTQTVLPGVVLLQITGKDK